MGGAGQVGYGPLWRIDGPPPIRPYYGLLQAAEKPAAGVRIVADIDDRGIERWINGVEVYPYPPDCASTFDACAPASTAEPKLDGSDLPLPQFGAFTVYVPVRCASWKIGDQDAYKARGVAALEAVQGSALENEFLTGDLMGVLSPHLSDGGGTFPNGDGVTSPLNGISLLEGEIARSCKLGLIHASPQLTAILRATGWALDERGGVLRTANGNVVIPGSGYVDGADPTNHAAAGENEEWMYASGPVDIRLSDIFVTPENVSEALDREQNRVVYRAERYAVVTWDTTLQAAVRVDRCQTTC